MIFKHRSIPLLIFIGYLILVLNSCSNKYELHKQYLSDSYEKSIDTVVFVPYRKGDKWFYVDRRTKGPYAGHAQAFDGEWLRAYPFNAYHLAKVNKGNHWAFIDTMGKEIIRAQLSDNPNYNFSEGLIPICNSNNVWGRLNYHGDTVTPFKYYSVGRSINGKARVEFGENNCGLINSKDSLLIGPGQYREVMLLEAEDTTGFVVVQDFNGKVSLLNKEFKPISSPKITWIDDFREGRGQVRCNDKHGYNGYIDYSGNLIIQCKYLRARDFHSGIAIVVNPKTRMYGGVDKIGKVIIPFEYGFLGDNGIQFGVLPAEKKGKCGLLNAKGDVLVDFRYENANFFSYEYGLVAVKRNGKWGMIDSLGNTIIKFKYELSSEFSQIHAITPNRIKVENKERKQGLVNRKNEVIAPVKFGYIGDATFMETFEFGLLPIIIEVDGIDKEGYIDIWGKEYFED